MNTTNKQQNNKTPVHHFDVEDAELYGVNAAVILYNLRFWLDKNLANKKGIEKGRVWTYNSVSAFSELFPYLKDHQVRYALKKLKDANVILTGSFNKHKYDRTKWYSINAEKYIIEDSEVDDTIKSTTVNNCVNSIEQNCTMNKTKVSNELNNSVQTIPYNKPYIKKDNNNTDINTDNKAEDIDESSPSMASASLESFEFEERIRKTAEGKSRHSITKHEFDKEFLNVFQGIT